MMTRRTSIVLFAVTLVSMAGLVVMASAAESERIATAAAGRVPVPTIPMADADSCVEDTDFMRRNHMDLLNHQRDATMHEGIRSKQHSLKECISCHVVMGQDAAPVTVSNPEHFCRSCHDYAAVKVDCFQCHASRPDSDDLPANHRLSNSVLSTLPAAPGAD